MSSKKQPRQTTWDSLGQLTGDPHDLRTPSQASETVDVRTHSYSWPFSIFSSLFSSSPGKSLEKACAGRGQAQARALRRKLAVTQEIAHSPEDYDHGHFSTWALVPVTPAKKGNISGLPFLGIQAPRVTESWATLSGNPRLHPDMAFSHAFPK